MKTKVFLCTLLLFCFLPAIASAQELMLNGGFESVITPNPWRFSPQARVSQAITWAGNHTIVPHSGDFMAILAPGGMGTQEIWQEVDFTGYSYATLSFWWRYAAIDLDAADNGRDMLEVFVGQPNSQNPWWDRILYAPINVDPSDGPIVSPWMFLTLSGDVIDAGNLTFRFRIRNDQASGGEPAGPTPENPTYGQLTVLFLDDVSVKAATSMTDMIEIINDGVEALKRSENLSDGLGNSLSMKLQAAYYSIERKNSKSATGQLKAFLNEVADLESEGILTPAGAASLRGPVGYLIGLLNPVQ